MKKKTLFFPLLLILFVSLVACAAPAPAPATTVTAPATTVTAPATTVTAPATTVTAPATTVTAPAPAPPKPTYNWRMSEIDGHADMPSYRGAEMFAELLTDRSDGRFNIDMYHGDMLGDWTVQAELVQLGNLEILFGGVYAGLDPRLNAAALNYMFANDQEAMQGMKLPNGWLAKSLEPIQDNVNHKVLAYYHNGWMGVGLAKGVEPPSTIEEAGKLKVRAEPLKVMELVVEALGFKPVVLPYSELYSALQLGDVDGWIGGAIQWSTIWADVLGTFFDTHNRINTLQVSMSLDLWNSLSQEDQEILQSTALEVQDWLWEAVQSEVDANYQAARDAGLVIVQPDPAYLAEVVERDRTIEWDYAERNLIGKVMMDEI